MQINKYRNQRGDRDNLDWTPLYFESGVEVWNTIKWKFPKTNEFWRRVDINFAIPLYDAYTVVYII